MAIVCQTDEEGVLLNRVGVDELFPHPPGFVASEMTERRAVSEVDCNAG